MPRVPKDGKHPAIAMVSQSGGLMAFASLTLAARALPVSYTVATGNEAGVGMPNFIDIPNFAPSDKRGGEPFASRTVPEPSIS